VRRQHGILNLQVLRIHNDRSTLETINVKLQQYYKRLSFSFRALDSLPFLSISNRSRLDVFILIQMLDETGEDLVLGVKALEVGFLATSSRTLEGSAPGVGGLTDSGFGLSFGVTGAAGVELTGDEGFAARRPDCASASAASRVIPNNRSASAKPHCLRLWPFDWGNRLITLRPGLWKAVTCHRFGLRRLDAAVFPWIQG
jgi:hypothetical protein